MDSSLGAPELRKARDQGRYLLAAVFLFSIFVNILMLTGPLFMLQTYDRVLGSRSEETLVALFILVCLLYLLMGILDYARGRVLARFGARFQNALDGRVFGAVMKRSLNPEFRAAPSTGLRDVETMQTVFTSPIMLAFFDIPWTPLFFAAVFVFHPVLGWMAVGGGAFLIFITFLNGYLTRSKMEAAQIATQKANSFAEQSRKGVETIRAQGMSSAIAARWHGMRDQALTKTVETSDWTGLFSAITKAFRLFLQSAMLAAGAWLVLRGEITPGAMIASSILLGRALAPIEQALGQWSIIQRAVSGWRLLSELLAQTPLDDAQTTKLPKPRATLVLNSVTVVAPGATTPTLSKIKIAIPAGKIIGVIGKSGSGKSTLAKTILGLALPATGEVRLGGATLDQYDPDDLGSFVGYLPQQVTLFSGTVAENIARMSTDMDEKKVIAAAQRANAHDMILALPEGYKTMVHGKESQLSGGQCQRIGLARAFYNDPVLLVLDEPNSALDADGSHALNAAVRDFKSSDRTVIIMTHRPLAIAECDRLIVIENGRVRADGPRDEIMQTLVGNADEIKKTIAGARAS